MRLYIPLSDAFGYEHGHELLSPYVSMSFKGMLLYNEIMTSHLSNVNFCVMFSSSGIHNHVSPNQ